MTKVYGSPFKIDWTSRQAVIEYAQRLGSGQSVCENTWPEGVKISPKYLVETRDNCPVTLSICHTARETELSNIRQSKFNALSVKVIHRT